MKNDDFTVYAETPPETIDRKVTDWDHRISQIPVGNWYCIGEWKNKSSASAYRAQLPKRFPHVTFKAWADPEAKRSKLYAMKQPTPQPR